jgi:hypothetical protein
MGRQYTIRLWRQQRNVYDAGKKMQALKPPVYQSAFILAGVDACAVSDPDISTYH